MATLPARIRRQVNSARYEEGSGIEVCTLQPFVGRVMKFAKKKNTLEMSSQLLNEDHSTSV